MRMMSNTSQNLPCVMCGGQGNIVRESQNAESCRVKCLSCNHTYSKQDSVDALAANAIPDGPPAPPAPIQEAEPQVVPQPPSSEPSRSQSTGVVGTTSVPRTPAFVFITKDRTHTQFTTKKDLKKVTLQWETAGRKYDVFELQSKKVSAKVVIS